MNLPAIKLFADTADASAINRLLKLPYIKGFTTNPTLMHSSGAWEGSYEDWCQARAKQVGDLPISFEVLADDFNEMERQARKIAAWGEHVYVKIPISDCQGKSSTGVIERLHKDGIKVNVTA